MSLRAQAVTSPSQDAVSASTLKVDARLVVVPAIVRDKNGALIKDLSKADFTLTVDEKPQTIRYFDRDNDVPLTLGLLVDTSQSQREVLDDEREGSRAFLDTLLTPAPVSGAGARVSDKAFVMQFAHDIELLQDVTDQRPPLNKALKELGTQSAEFHTADAPDKRDEEGRRIRQGGTALYDALFLASDEITGRQKGRRALVVLSDGVDNGSKDTIEDAIEAAQRADTVVYAIYYQGEQRRGFDRRRDSGGNRGGYPGGGYPGSYPGGGYPGSYPGGGYPGGGYPGNNPGSYPGDPGSGYPGGSGGQGPAGGSGRRPYIDGKRALGRICAETGGRMFVLSKKQTVEQAYKEIGEELRSQYRLGFTPDSAAATEKYHRLQVALGGAAGGRKLELQTREGYYPPKS